MLNNVLFALFGTHVARASRLESVGVWQGGYAVVIGGMCVGGTPMTD